MGHFVREALAAEGVDVSQVRTDRERLTAIVVLGIRDRETFPLIFYRENCADMALEAADIDPAYVARASALVVTGTHFSAAKVDAASRTAIAAARAAGTKIVLDIDYRPVLWGLTGKGDGETRYVSSASVTAHLQSIVHHCDLIVGTEDEIRIAGGAQDTLAALRRLRELSKAVIVLKRGSEGATIFDGAIPDMFVNAIDCPGFPVEVFNVLGAGDGFMAGLVTGWLRGNNWKEAGRIANACGALVVARHGCAPAMPSRVELDAFLARAEEIRVPRQDLALAHLHRVTTGRRPRPEVLALAFDHRRQFEELGQRTGAAPERIRAFKHLIGEAVTAVHREVPELGAIVDDRYGADVLARLTGRGIWLARPVELPGSRPLAFEAESEPALTLRIWPAEHVAKCLVFHDAADPEPMRQAQEAALLELQRAAHATGHEWLLELIPPPGRAPEAVVQPTVERLYRIGLVPDWWKLPPSTDPRTWQKIGDTIRAHDSHARGVLILGLDASDSELASAFVAAADEPMVRGFAVGRTIFWPAAEQWFAGSITDFQALRLVTEACRRVVAHWRQTRPILAPYKLAGIR
jgi:5-dehydro-2-deoxygluconokinase